MLAEPETTTDRGVPVKVEEEKEEEVPQKTDYSPSTIMASFLFMTACFAVTHGCVMSLIGYSAEELGTTVAGAQNGTLSVAYVLSALFFSGAFSTVFGTKYALFLSLLLYVANAVAYFLTIIFPVLGMPIACGGGFLCRIGAGTLWTAQGAYFGETCKVYGVATGMPASDVTSMFGSYFAFLYLGIEVLGKILSSILYNQGGIYAVYLVLVFLSAGGAIGIFFIRDFSAEVKRLKGETNVPTPSFCSTETLNKIFNKKKAFGAIDLLMNDGRMRYIYPGPMAFSSLTVLLNIYVIGVVVADSDNVGGGDVGNFGATLSGCAAVFSVIFGRVEMVTGKGPVYILGQFIFFCEALIFLVTDNYTLGNKMPLFVLYGLHGMGRATYVSTMRSLFADIWSDDEIRPFAFANLIIANGGAAAVFSFLYPYISRDALGLISIFLAVMGIIGFYEANYRALDEKFTKYKAKYGTGEEEEKAAVVGGH